MNIGILGGTFDPIHNAHIEIAKCALNQFELDKVWIMPTPNPPHKDKDKIAGKFHRVNMIKLAIKDVEGVEFSDFELNQPDVTYTADTLSMLKELYPENNYYFIIGSDSVLSFVSWYRPDVILKYAKLLVVRRQDESFRDMDIKVKEIEEQFGTEIGIIEMKSRMESSSFIRSHLEDSKNMVSGEVYSYILDNKLYTDEINIAWSAAKILDDLKKILKVPRYEHTLGVADTAKKLAERFHVNPNKAYYAAILHDCAKNFSDTELLEICRKNKLPISKKEQNALYLLHAKVGAFMAKNKYGITDSEILEAITWHTTGKAEMSLLEKIIFCADYIEPGRTKQPNLEYLRELANKDLDLLVYNILKDTVEYLNSRDDDVIEEHTLEAYEFYKKLIEERYV